jgi:hypothetical protein
LTSLPSRACLLSETCIPYCLSIAIAHLGEQSCPDGLNLLDLGSLDQGLELVGLGELAPAHCVSHSHVDGGDRTVISTPSSARMRAA